MGDITDIFNGRVDIKRLTSFVLDGITPSAAMSFDRQPPRESRLSIKVSGATVANGLINIAGSTTETITFSTNDTKVSTKTFTTLSGLTLSGIDGGSIYIEAVNKLGQPNNQECNIYTSLPIRFYTKNGKIVMDPAGQEKQARYKIMAEEDKDLQENDLMVAVSGVVGLTRGTLTFVRRIVDFGGTGHHLESEVKDI